MRDHRGSCLGAYGLKFQVYQARVRRLVTQLKGYANGGYQTRVIDADFCNDFAQYLLTQVKPSSARGYLERL